ncbi:FxSxx-COOH system tetratricopeptide repeat protein [Streptomyces sp. NPDC047461]|uniref:FxSxx-COOH system tetratricopeptide repeat protein n=1 Tax=Streptomyces sp. NPDC047461 TaxID=3155619 RepID=UPI0033FCFC15
MTFYSYKGGVGRTMALANIAWLLADRGHRVLAVDWDLESPGLHRYFRPLLRDPELTDSPGVVEMVQDYGRAVEALRAEPLPDVETESRLAELLERHTQTGRHTDSLDYRFAHPDGRIDFLGPGRQDGLYSERVASFDWPRFYEELHGRLFAEALRESLRSDDYDYVLIDSRTGHSDNASLCTLILPDVVVVGFNLSNQSIDGSAAVARQVREQSGGRIRVLPVPMRVDDSQPEQAERRRSRARDQFAGALGPILLTGEEQYWREVEVGHLSNAAYEEVLLPFVLPNYAPSLQKQAYERLAQEISGSRELCFEPVPEVIRMRYAEEFAEVPASPRVVRLVFEPQDRPTADWIRAELIANGVMCEFDRETGERMVRGEASDSYLVLMSSAMACSPHLTRLGRHIRSPRGLADRPRVDVAWLEDVLVQPPFADRPGPKLYMLEEEPARNALLTHFLPGDRHGTPWAGRSGYGPRFPGRHPRVWHVLRRRQGDFLGREDYLQQLRNALPPGQAAQPVVLTGPDGVGKRTLAMEYLNRFRADYNVVWWMPADSSEDVERELALLSEELDASRRSSPRAIEALRDLLGRQKAPDRLLLVYDDAPAPAVIESLLITSPRVHVLITSECPDWGTLAHPVAVESPSAEEAISYLRRKAPQLSGELAARLVALGEPLPQLLDQMAAYLNSTERPPEAAVAELAKGIEDRQAVGLEMKAAVWQSVVEDLGQERPAALDLLRMLTALSPEGAGWDLLESAAALEFLGLPEGKEGKRQLGFAARALTGRSQARFGQNGKRLTAARMILSSQRRELTAEEAASIAEGVRRVLAAYAPGDDHVDDPDMDPRYAELDRHVDASGVAEDESLEVRRWLVNQVRYRRRTQCPAVAFALAEQLERTWTAPMPDRDDDRLLLLLRLRVELANIHTEAGDYPAANRVNDAALEELRRIQGLDGEFTLRSALGRGGELRALGRPQDALAEDQATQDIMRAKYGPADHFTLMASSNLGLSLAMIGLPKDSLAQHTGVHEKRVRVSGELHPLTLRSSVNVGSSLRETGRYEDSLSRLQEIYRQTVKSEEYGPTHLVTARTASSLASTLRHIAALSPGLSGQARKAKVDSARMLDSRAADAYEAYGGPRHPGALVARVGLAADQRILRRIEGAKGARALAEGNLAAYRERGEDHIFTRICEVNLALALREADDESAAELSERGLYGLREKLWVDRHHPLILTAALCHANMLVFAGDSQAARELDEETYEGLLEKFGPEHPLTLTVAAHLGLREDVADWASPGQRVSIELDIPRI